MFGVVAKPEGITNPPLDELLKAADSKYALVVYGAKRARQINSYYSQIQENALTYVGPLVETYAQEKPLSIAFREIDEGLLTVRPMTEAEREVEQNQDAMLRLVEDTAEVDEATVVFTEDIDIPVTE